MTRQASCYVLLSTVLLLAACASPTVVQSVRPDDAGLNCEQLQRAFTEAESFRSDAAKEKTVTQGNVVRAILFWPAVLGTAENANEAIAAADARKVHLANQMALRNCGTATNGQPVNAKPVGASVFSNDATVDPNAPKLSKEEKLEELRRLYYMNYVSKGAYSEMKKAIVDAP